MLDKFLSNKMLSPLLPTNQTLLELGNVDFKRYMEKWTESARVAPYVPEVDDKEDDAASSSSLFEFSTEDWLFPPGKNKPKKKKPHY